MKKIKGFVAVMLSILLVTSFIPCALPAFAETGAGTPNTFYVDGIDTPFTSLGAAVTAAKSSPLHTITLGGDCTMSAANANNAILLYTEATAGNVIIDGGKTDTFEGYSMSFTWTTAGWFGSFLGYDSSLTIQNMKSLSFANYGFVFHGDATLSLDNITSVSTDKHLIEIGYNASSDTDGATTADININNVGTITVGQELMRTAADSVTAELDINKVANITGRCEGTSAALFYFPNSNTATTINIDADNSKSEAVADTGITVSKRLMYTNNATSSVTLNIRNYNSVTTSTDLLVMHAADEVNVKFENVGSVGAGTFMTDVRNVVSANVNFVNADKVYVNHCILSAQTYTTPNISMSFDSVGSLYSMSNVMFYVTKAQSVNISLNNTTLENANSVIQTGNSTSAELNAVGSSIKITGNNPIIKSESTVAVTVSADEKSSFILSSAGSSYANGNVNTNDSGAKYTVCADALNAGVTLPVVKNDGKVFIGFSNGDELVKGGVVYTDASATASVTFTPVYFTNVDFDIKDGASIRTKNGSGIRFSTTVSDELLNALGNNVSFGTIIGNVSILGDGVAPTHDDLNDTPVSIVCVKQTKWDGNTFHAALINVPDNAQSYQLKLAGRAYMTVEYVNGTETFYTEFDTNNIRSMYDVAVILTNNGQGSAVTSAIINTVNAAS